MIRRRSKKRASEDAKAVAAMECFRLEFNACWQCERLGSFWNPLAVHHIAGRAHRLRDSRANWCRLCRECHESYHVGKFRLVHALALKSVYDAEHYDRATVLAIRGYRETAITEDEVLAQVAYLRSGGRFVSQ